MSNPKHHHHVAQFYLGGWTGPDGRLCVFSRKGPMLRLVSDWHSAEYVGYEPFLYTIPSWPSDPQWVEREIFAKQVDDPASKALQVMLEGGLNKLTDKQIVSWTRFLVAQWYRSPEAIAKLLRKTIESLDDEFRRDPQDYGATQTRDLMRLSRA